MKDVLAPEGSRKEIRFWAPIKEVEQQALVQVSNIASLPWVFHHVAIMGDVHYGKGATVGSVIAMKGACSPAAVGVDIGCGMAAVKTSLKASDLPDNLEGLRSALEAAVPVGFNSHPEDADQFAWPHVANQAFALFGRFSRLHPGVQNLLDRAVHQLGTLGGGNHFIELCLDEGGQVACNDLGGHTDLKSFSECSGYHYQEPRVWLMLHSGSRNIGKELAARHIEVAKKLAHNQDLPDPDLAVFLSETPEMAAYRNDLSWAQEFAWLNRLVMLELCKKVLRKKYFNRLDFDAPIACHHNYLSDEHHYGEKVMVTRKGAISARKGELGIIPGSMGTSSYIVRGLGNEESFHSASHGAGRRLSRGAAKRKFTVEDLAAQTSGVCCRKDEGVLDEIPGAYKSIDEVMANQADLVEVVARLRQVLCIKG